MSQPSVPVANEDEDDNPYTARGRDRWRDFTHRVVADPVLDSALFMEALQFALIKAANIVFTELAEVTARQAAWREQERGGRKIVTRTPRRKSAGASVSHTSSGGSAGSTQARPRAQA